MFNPVIETEELGRLIKAAPSHVARKARRLSDEHAFPRPLPGVPGRWSRRLVEAWIATNGAVGAPANTDTFDAHAGLVEAQRAQLEQRYGGRA